MSRSGYTDDCEDQWDLIRWRGAVASATRGARGQAMLRELLTALDAMPIKELIAGELQADGEFCALGVLGASRGKDLIGIDPYDRETVAAEFDIAEALAAEVMHINDESIADEEYVDVQICGPMRPNYPDWGHHTRSKRVAIPDVGARRWRHMRAWVASQIKEGVKA